MKLNFAYPATGQQKVFEFEDEKKLRIFYEKRMAQEVEIDSLGDERKVIFCLLSLQNVLLKGYVVRIAGGNDKQGFPMKQGILTNGRVRLLLAKGQSCYRPRKTGERKRKSVRGCIVDANLSALALVVVKKGTFLIVLFLLNVNLVQAILMVFLSGDNEIEGLTDQVLPRKLGPKRASKIRKLFNLTKDDDVTKYVITHEKTTKSGECLFSFWTFQCFGDCSYLYQMCMLGS